jgi:PHD/YefM family antitoxin component YafN of YafNO toxin-antitoxin module
MKKVALSEVKDDLSRLLRLAEKEDVVITRHGKQLPAGMWPKAEVYVWRI